ncbi:MAG: AAA family ATPase, partial [Chlamydiia bacterium]|nr:AAA family ATPase [Chlamydiia bacterium]
MERDLYQQLLNWKKSNKRKPLILKGVRQVGKTYLLQRFGIEHFSQTHYLNFEKNPKLCEIFEPNLDPNRILTDLSLHFQKRIDITSDLIIFDE